GKTGAGHNSVAEAQRSGEEIFLNLRIALETAPNLPHAEPGLSHPIQLRVGDLKPGDIGQTDVLETRDAGVYLAEVFGGYSNYGLLPIAVPIESVWREGDLIKVRVRFGYAVTGEGVFPPELRVYAARKKSPKASLFRRILSWP
ncbi:MAG: hypothetical protein HY747_03710, partial [Elusimicrobia bacterium]|nr:hypothetical protein [Elusimicrobiota bacterium]